MNLRQYHYVIVLGCLMLVLCLGASCGISGQRAASSPPVLESTERRTTLIFWHAWPSPEQHMLTTLIDRYNQLHPHTQIILHPMPVASITSELQSAARVGGGPHLVLLQSQSMGGLVEQNLLLPIDDTLLTVEQQQAILSTALQSAQVLDSSGKTQLYGFPLTFDTLALYYHKEALNVPPTTTDVLLQRAHTLTNTSEQPPVWGLAYTLSLDKTIGYLPAFDGRVFDEQGNVVLGRTGRPGTEQWLQWLLELQQDDKILAVSDSIDIDSALKAQEALMTIDWSHALSGYHALWGDALGVAVLPNLSSTNLPPQPYVQSDVLIINAQVVDEVEQAVAVDFAHYLLSAEAQQALLDVGKQPTLLSLQLDGETPELEAARTFRSQAQQGQAMPNSRAENETVREELERMQLEVLRGLATPTDAVTYTDAVLRERFDAQMSQ